METLEVVFESTDGHIVGNSFLYSVARSTSTGSSDSGTTFTVGQRQAASAYDVWRGGMETDVVAGGLPVDAVLSSATLQVVIAADSSTTNFSGLVVQPSLTFPIGGASRETNYDAILALKDAGLGTLFNTATGGFGAGTVCQLAIATDSINLAGKTQLAILSSRDAGNNTPSASTNEFVTIHSATAAVSANRPRLILQYEVPSYRPPPPGWTHWRARRAA